MHSSVMIFVYNLHSGKFIKYEGAEVEMDINVPVEDVPVEDIPV